MQAALTRNGNFVSMAGALILLLAAISLGYTIVEPPDKLIVSIFIGSCFFVMSFLNWRIGVLGDGLRTM